MRAKSVKKMQSVSISPYIVTLCGILSKNIQKLSFNFNSCHDFMTIRVLGAEPLGEGVAKDMAMT